jgi:hypothetical protein
MGLIEARTVTAFVLGAGVALGGWAAGSASASESARTAAAASAVQAAPAAPAAPAALTTAVKPPLVVLACANKKTGVVTVRGAGTRHTRCLRTELPITFATPAKPFPAIPPSLLSKDGSLRLKSPNGQYALVLTNTGVGLKGPGGALLIDPFGVKTFDSTGRAK